MRVALLARAACFDTACGLLSMLSSRAFTISLVHTIRKGRVK
jgi:hypothetical protein